MILETIGAVSDVISGVSSLFGGLSQAEKDSIDLQNRMDWIQKQLAVYNVDPKYVPPEWIDDILHGNGVWQSKTQRMFYALSSAITGKMDFSPEGVFAYKDKAIQYVNSVKSNFSNQYKGLNTNFNGVTTQNILPDKELPNPNHNYTLIYIILAVVILGFSYFAFIKK